MGFFQWWFGSHAPRTTAAGQDDKVSANSILQVAPDVRAPDTGATGFTVYLSDVGRNKIQVIKALRDVSGLSLKDALLLVDSSPRTVLGGLSQAAAGRACNLLLEAGATAEIRSVESGDDQSHDDQLEALDHDDLSAPGSVDVILVSPSASTIQTIKVVRALTSVSLKEAQDLVTGAPSTIRAGATRRWAEYARRQLVEIGATVDVAEQPASAGLKGL